MSDPRFIPERVESIWVAHDELLLHLQVFSTENHRSLVRSSRKVEWFETVFFRECTHDLVAVQCSNDRESGYCPGPELEARAREETIRDAFHRGELGDDGHDVWLAEIRHVFSA